MTFKNPVGFLERHLISIPKIYLFLGRNRDVPQSLRDWGTPRLFNVAFTTIIHISAYVIYTRIPRDP